MRYEIENVSPVVQKITFDVPAETINEKFTNYYREILPHISIRGFRRGRVPLRVVKKNPKYRKYVAEQVLNDVRKECIDELFKEYPNKFLFHLDLNDESQIKEGQNYKFSITFEVRPEIELPELSEIKVPYKVIEPTDEDIREELEHIREKHAILTPVDREVKGGDLVAVEFFIADDEEKLSERSEENIQKDEVIVGDLSLPKEFNLNIVGMKKGEEKSFSYTLQTKGEEEGESSETTKYMWIKVLEVKEKTLPELDDELAKSENFDSLEELKENLKEKIKEKAQKESREITLEEAIEQIAQKVEIPIPENLLQNQINNRLLQIIRLYSILGEGAPIIEEEKERIKNSVIRDLKREFILYTLIDKHSFSAEEEEIEEKIRELARSRNESPAYLKQNLKPEEKEDIINSIKKEKALDYIFENIEKIEEKISLKDFEKFLKDREEAKRKADSEKSDGDEKGTEGSETSEGEGVLEKENVDISSKLPPQVAELLNQRPPLSAPNPELLKGEDK